MRQIYFYKNNYSKRLFVDRKEESEVRTENFKGKEVTESAETIAGKSKTVKIEFEKHPHEFDFSFIQDEDMINKDRDLLTDQVFKEISEIN